MKRIGWPDIVHVHSSYVFATRMIPLFELSQCLIAIQSRPRVVVFVCE
jgi:hypothetical protein